MTSEPFVLDPAAQTIAVEVFSQSATGDSGVEVYILSGSGYATSTRVVQVLCSTRGYREPVDLDVVATAEFELTEPVQTIEIVVGGAGGRTRRMRRPPPERFSVASRRDAGRHGPALRWTPGPPR